MKGIELLKKLQQLHKPFYTIADLEKISGLSRNSLYVALSRWTANGLVERMAQGIYCPLGVDFSVERTAAQLYLPNYLSFESALSRHGVLNLIPYSLTFATTRKTRKYSIQGHNVEFRKIASELFFGFTMEGGICLASPEKAFLDELYLVSRGKTQLDMEEIDLKKLKLKKLKALARPYPAYVQRFLQKIVRL